MKKYINFLCVLILALTLIDLVMSIFFSNNESSDRVVLKNITESQLLLLFGFALVVLGCLITAFVSFIKFILNINRNEVFTRKNISLLRWYAAATLMASVCLVLIGHYFPTVLDLGVEEIIEGVIEGAFALLIAEVFSIGMKLEEEKNTAA